ncbi:MAG: hypothetical protein IKN72_10990 [Clostridia bacterium]|nr:hypothetical protein [Clostridia bacterium]
MKRKARRLQETPVPAEPVNIGSETGPAKDVSAPDTVPAPGRTLKRAEKRTAKHAEPATDGAAEKTVVPTARTQPTHREILSRRKQTLERTVRFGKFAGKSVKRVTGLIRRASSLVDRVMGLPPKIKALTGFDVMGLLSK